MIFSLRFTHTWSLEHAGKIHCDSAWDLAEGGEEQEQDACGLAFVMCCGSALRSAIWFMGMGMSVWISILSKSRSGAKRRARPLVPLDCLLVHFGY